ncbi:uncharacterized protein N7482_006384 [Penicillium canariense]|uniref:Uncharacterized protein n=1 Tax=Penicillium canariense TaxID=189055 RepID=A0A9W9LIX3_9EURO|nr:uncharacterized protein N7482_006384 [Penicillium canariense]KAJ5159380.1 hypothetical protein N7482_006384 [Penicillium canariense]
MKTVTSTEPIVNDSADAAHIETVYDCIPGDGFRHQCDLLRYHALSSIADSSVVEQDYGNGSRFSPTGTPTNEVPIKPLTVDGITGSVESEAVEV